MGNILIAPIEISGKESSMIISRLDSWSQRVEKFLTAISWIVSVLVTLMFVVDIFMRFLFKRPLPASWEIAEVCMPLIIFLPFAYTLTIDAHVRVSIVKDRLPPKIRLGFETVSNSIAFIICAMFTYWAWLYFWDSFIINEEMLAAIKIPWWVGKMAMPIGMGFFTFRYLILVFRSLAHQK
jgi:TRAP-type C4-dicarboxylate transport system permease small subunit